MRYTLLVCFSLCCRSLLAQSFQSQEFPLPKAHVWDLKAKQFCNSVGSARIRQASESADPSQNLVVQAGVGVTRLEITMEGEGVLVSLDGEKPEKYKVVANTVGLLTAILVGDPEPSISSISVDKLTSYVLWSTTEPRDFKHDVPRNSAALLSCSPFQR